VSGLREGLAGMLRFERMRLAPWEVLLGRLGVAAVVWLALDGNSDFTTQDHPNGLARWFDLTWLSNDHVETPLRWGARGCLLAWVLGVPAAFSLALPVWLGIGIFTLRNSQGAIGHSYQVVHLCLLTAWLAGCATLVRRWRGSVPADALTSGQLELDWARQALAAGYVVSAITKLVVSGGWWFRDSQFFALHLVKNNDMQYYGFLDPAALRGEWAAEWMMRQPFLSQVFFGLALPLELLAFLGCWNRRLALFFGAGLVVFHLLVKQLTQLNFEFNMLLLVVLMVNPAWWFWRGLARVARGKQRVG
jgi:hypothetical protein